MTRTEQFCIRTNQNTNRAGRIWHRLLLICFVLSVHCTTDSYDTSDKAVIGGEQASIDEVPWQVRVVGNNGVYCGGVIIHPSWVVTAAHCLKPRYAMSQVIAGRSFKRGRGGQVRGVQRSVKDPEYTGLDKDGHDIALIKVDSPFSLGGDNVQAINIPTQAQAERLLAPGRIGILSGFGAIGGTSSRNVERTDRLHKVELEIRTLQYAIDVYGEISDDFVVAGGGAASSCYGDSGGPLAVFDSSDTPYLAGVVMGTDPRGLDTWDCGIDGMPTLFTSAPLHGTWIYNVTDGAVGTPPSDDGNDDDDGNDNDGDGDSDGGDNDDGIDDDSDDDNDNDNDGGPACGAFEIYSCDRSRCVPSSWQGDGECDAALNCSDHDSDGGDCRSDGGEPEPVTSRRFSVTREGYDEVWTNHRIKPGSSVRVSVVPFRDSSSGDLHLYAAFGRTPSREDNDCSANTTSHRETCTLIAPSNGDTTLSSRVGGDRGGIQYSITVEYTPAP